MASPAYRPEIDGLRALAIVPVMLFHAFPEQFPGGFVGVDIFFVISGYLISRILLGGLADGSFSFADFYARRVRRIVPALLVVLLSAGALGWLLLAPEDFRQLGKHVLAGATFTSNFLLWHEAGYFDAAAEAKPLLHLWSLAVEEQFYLVWPLLLWLAWKSRIAALPVAVAVGGASFLANLHFVVDDPDGAFYSPASRFWELMVGCALAARERAAQPPPPRAHANAIAVIGLAMIAAALALVDRQRAFPGAWALLPTLGTALLVGSSGAWLHENVFARGPLVRLGLMSYALYLWHWPLLVFLSAHHAERAPAVARLLALLLAAVLAWLTYVLVERRIRALPAKAVVPPLALSGLLVIVLGVLTYRADLSPNERLEARLEAAQSWPAGYSEDRRCREKHPTAGYCVIADPAAAPTHALIGDSHANHFYPGLAAEVARGGGNLIHLGNAGCIPFSGLESSHRLNCALGTEDMLRYVLAAPGIRTVILAANWHAYAPGTRFSIYRQRQASKLILSSQQYGALAGNEALFAAGLSRTLDLLEGAGRNVVFLLQAPELDSRFQYCLQTLRAASGGWDDRLCAVPRRKVDAYVAEYARLVDAVLAGRQRVRVLDPLDALCDGDLCRAVIGGELMYRDDVHLGVAGSRHVMRKLWPAAAAPAR